MQTVGIVAEYNPFHNGHLHQLRRARELSGAEGVVVALSQECLQRGSFSSFDKLWRTRLALRNGADLVLGLPYPVSGQSAEHFAAGAVEILQKAGVTALSFGAETDSPERLTSIAEALVDEPAAFKASLASPLKEGLSYPKARQMALEESLGERLPELASPNNILAIEYIKAALKSGTGFSFYPVRRVGKGYHDTGTDGGYPSATGVRNALLNGDCASLSGGLPYSVEELRGNFTPLREELYFASLKAKLLEMDLESLTEIQGVDGDLANKILKRIGPAHSLGDLFSGLKSKNLTHTSLSRALMNVSLGFTKEDMRLYHSGSYDPYMRVLGFTALGRAVLKEDVSGPIVANISKDVRRLSEAQEYFLKKDLKAANFRGIFLGLEEYNKDYYQKPVIV